jgi:hypothetical protein
VSGPAGNGGHRTLRRRPSTSMALWPACAGTLALQMASVERKGSPVRVPQPAGSFESHGVGCATDATLRRCTSRDARSHDEAARRRGAHGVRRRVTASSSAARTRTGSGVAPRGRRSRRPRCRRRWRSLTRAGCRALGRRVWPPGLKTTKSVKPWCSTSRRSSGCGPCRFETSRLRLGSLSRSLSLVMMANGSSSPLRTTRPSGEPSRSTPACKRR